MAGLSRAAGGAARLPAVLRSPGPVPVNVVTIALARRVGRVLVRGLRAAHLAGEPGHGDPVGAGVAVHPDVAADRLLIALEDEGRQFVAAADELREPHVDTGVAGGEPA